MKKYIITILVLLIIPSFGFAWNMDEIQNGRIDALENRAAALEKLIGELQAKINQVEANRIDLSVRFAQHVSQATPTPITQIIQSPDQQNQINDLDRRVSLLERAVSSIQNVVLTAINKAISILEGLLK